jgi:hypothetical protein
VDAIVTLQAAHETRHKRHLCTLLGQCRSLLAPDGMMLFADQYAAPGNGKNPELFATPQEQEKAARAAWFTNMATLLDMHGMALLALH